MARSRYDEQLDRLLALFGRQQLLVLRSEDLFTAPQTVWQRLQGFLELKPRPLPDPMPHANRGGGESAGVDTGFRDRLRSLLSPTYDALERNYGIRW